MHRDLKPDNVFLTSDDLIKILDFGLARFAKVEPEADTSDEALTAARATTPGTVLGTMGYMSPEQARGREADHRSDIFSVGAILYEMLRGQRAFHGESSADTLSAILNQDPPSLVEGNLDVPLALERIVKRCLEKDAARRFQSAKDLAFTLETISDLKRASDQRRRTPAADATPSIAVLPFADMSPQKDQDYFCEGMAEEIINALAKIEGLRVAARTSTFQFKGKAEDIRTIGEALNVKTVLEGSVRTAGSRLRVTAQLIGVSDGYDIWSDRYDGTMEDVFAIQDEIASKIVGALKVKLVGAAEGPRVKRHTRQP